MAGQSVDAFLGKLVHARRADILRVIEIIMTAEPTLTQTVKWNAPSFAYAGDDRITFRLHPGDRVDLVFHRGAKKTDPDSFSFADPSGLLRMVAPDRGIVEFADAAQIDRSADDLKLLVSAWIVATTKG